MIINNKEVATRIRLGIMMFTLVYLALIVLSLIYNFSKNHMIEIISTIIFAIVAILFFMRKYCYIFYNNEASKIILRYMPLQPLSSGNYSIEIPKKDFVKFEVKKSALGLRESVIMYVRTPNGIAKFKPVSLSSLKKSEKQDLIASLDSML